MFTDAFADRLRSIRETKLVPGLLFRIAPAKLKQHLLDRQTHHEQRAKDKKAEIPNLEDLVTKFEASIDAVKGLKKDEPSVRLTGKGMANRSYEFDGGDQLAGLREQIANLQTDVKNHENKAISFGVLAESLFDATDAYALTWPDLQQIELAR